jgi:hypothetical protein
MLSTDLLDYYYFLFTLATRIVAARHHPAPSGFVAAAIPAQTSQAKDAAADYYAITGVDTGRDTQTGARPARRNILDLQNDGPSWFVIIYTFNIDYWLTCWLFRSLYIQALTEIQNADDSDPLSYFQVAGQFLLFGSRNIV